MIKTFHMMQKCQSIYPIKNFHNNFTWVAYIFATPVGRIFLKTSTFISHTSNYKEFNILKVLIIQMIIMYDLYNN